MPHEGTWWCQTNNSIKISTENTNWIGINQDLRHWQCCRSLPSLCFHNFCPSFLSSLCKSLDIFIWKIGFRCSLSNKEIRISKASINKREANQILHEYIYIYIFNMMDHEGGWGAKKIPEKIVGEWLCRHGHQQLVR